MQTFYADYLKNLEELHDDIMRSINGLPREALDWIPFESANSMSVMIVHLTGAERYWFSDFVAGESSGRDRDSEFKVKNLTHEQLSTRLKESRAYTKQVLNTLDLDDLAIKQMSFRHEQEVSIAWALGHALKHTAIHLGHIQLTRQLWDLQAEV